MQNFHDLKAWQKAHQMALDVYSATESFPKAEMYGLTSQMRRAAVSVPSNIAEGCGRGGLPELIQFCQTAFGSATELEYQIILARDLAYMDDELHGELTSRVQEVKRMLASLLRTLRERAGREHTKGFIAYRRRPESTETLSH